MIRSSLVAVALVLAAGAARGEEGESPAAQAGHNLYEQHCQICHGMRGEGDGAFAGELRTAPANLTILAKKRKGVFPDVEVREIIDGRRRLRAHGPSDMPIWGREFGINAVAGSAHESIVRDRISALVTYLKSIQKP